MKACIDDVENFLMNAKNSLGNSNQCASPQSRINERSVPELQGKTVRLCNVWLLQCQTFRETLRGKDDTPCRNESGVYFKVHPHEDDVFIVLIMFSVITEPVQ